MPMLCFKLWQSFLAHPETTSIAHYPLPQSSHNYQTKQSESSKNVCQVDYLLTNSTVAVKQVGTLGGSGWHNMIGSIELANVVKQPHRNLQESRSMDFINPNPLWSMGGISRHLVLDVGKLVTVTSRHASIDMGPPRHSKFPVLNRWH